jgi:signal transduction histidine kinase
VQLTLKMTGESVELIIQDNGQGFDATHLEKRGIGLLSMQERMKALGGATDIASTPGQGTRLVACCGRLGIGDSVADPEQIDRKKRDTMQGAER